VAQRRCRREKVGSLERENLFLYGGNKESGSAEDQSAIKHKAVPEGLEQAGNPPDEGLSELIPAGYGIK